MNKEYIRINNQPFSILSLLRFVTVLALIISCFIVFPWNWLNASMDWDLRLNYWICFTVFETIGLAFWLKIILSPRNSNEMFND
jgi:hypothetical protein